MTTTDIIEKAHISTLSTDPYATWIFEAGDRFIQVTNYGGFNEEFLIEVSSTFLTSYDDPWVLFATAHSRTVMRMILKSLINEYAAKDAS